MNKKTMLAIVVGAAAMLLLGIAFGRYLRQAPPTPIEAQPLAFESQEVAVAAWTCSMHPQILQPAAGACPICGMDLIPLVQDAAADDGPRAMSMSESARALAEIRTTPVQRDLPIADIRLVGELRFDETRVKSLAARFPARIDRLYVNFTGIRVERGQHMAEVYSPELLIAQRELLTAHSSDPQSSITQVTREKLRLWDLQPDQIDAILQTGEVRDHIELRAPVGGVVLSKNVKEGDYVDTGDALFSIVDLSELWLFLDAYESDLTWLRYGQDVAFTVESFPGETFHGRIAFIEPNVTRMTRTVPIRVNVPNADGRLKPGMFARASVQARMAAGGKVYAPELAGKWVSPMHPEIVKDGPGTCDVCGMDLVPAEQLGYVRAVGSKEPLVIPASAVLRTGKRSVVYVELPDRERPTYEGREITLGPRAGDFFIVTDGLREGERVVSNGAFKIDSALQIQAKPSMMNPQGGAATRASVEIPRELTARLVEPYLATQVALAADDLKSAKAGVKTMAGVAGQSGALHELLRAMLDAGSLDALRKPHFDSLSQALISSIKSDPSAISGKLYVMHCPMVYGKRGADWLQATDALSNPYFGAAMLGCGEIKETLSSAEPGHGAHEH